MPSPFPGMDPYLEDPGFWPDFHHTFITAIRAELQPMIRPRYHARVQERVYLETPDDAGRVYYPDVTVLHRGGREGVATLEADALVTLDATAAERVEPFIEIVSAASGHRVVTVIEVLSPSNKDPGGHREAYRRRQRQILGSDVNLVEIDLLRAGEHTAAVPRQLAGRQPHYDYLVSISRPADRSRFECYFFTVRDRMPRILIPLAAPDPDAVADLRKCLDRCYDEADYRAVVDYGRPANPPLSPEDAAWAEPVISARNVG